MSKYSPKEIEHKTEMAEKVLAHYFGKKKTTLKFKPAGKTNYVFEASLSDGDFIVRIAAEAHKYPDFKKEEWAAKEAAKRGVPVPEILEVGHSVVPLPYMLQRKIEGKEAADHPKRLDILRDLGSYARIIHSVKTTGFGSVFNWSRATKDKHATWSGYLDNELKAAERMGFLKKHGFLSTKKMSKLTRLLANIRRWKAEPCLNHCDLRLKNAIANRAGKIQAIIDWENCESNMAPYWDLSIALHDLSIDGKQHFLDGYDLDPEAFSRMSYALTVFNLLNYTPTLQRIIDRNDAQRLALYRLRLDSSFDLFSL